MLTLHPLRKACWSSALTRPPRLHDPVTANTRRKQRASWFLEALTRALRGTSQPRDPAHRARGLRQCSPVLCCGWAAKHLCVGHTVAGWPGPRTRSPNRTVPACQRNVADCRASPPPASLSSTLITARWKQQAGCRRGWGILNVAPRRMLTKWSLALALDASHGGLDCCWPLRGGVFNMNGCWERGQTE